MIPLLHSSLPDEEAPGVRSSVFWAFLSKEFISFFAVFIEVDILEMSWEELQLPRFEKQSERALCVFEPSTMTSSNVSAPQLQGSPEWPQLYKSVLTLRSNAKLWESSLRTLESKAWVWDIQKSVLKSHMDFKAFAQGQKNCETTSGIFPGHPG